MLTLIRILSFAGIIAAPLLYAVKCRIDRQPFWQRDTINQPIWRHNVINLIASWGAVSAASLFSPLAFCIVTGIIAGWTIVFRTYLICFDMRCECSIFRYGDLAPYYLSSLTWIVLLILSFF